MFYLVKTAVSFPEYFQHSMKQTASFIIKRELRKFAKRNGEKMTVLQDTILFMYCLNEGTLC